MLLYKLNGTFLSKEIGEYPERLLPDGSTRKTFATESENGPEYPECIKDESEVISRYFSDVDMQVSSLIMEIVGNNHDLQWMEGEKMGNFASAGFKDHIHVYTGSDNGTRNNQKVLVLYNMVNKNTTI